MNAMDEKTQQSYDADGSNREEEQQPEEFSRKKRLPRFFGRILFFVVVIALFAAFVLGTDAIIDWVKSIFPR